MVTYSDVAMCFPIIESYVFLGKNLSDENLVDTWYFQSTTDYSRYGSASKGNERPAICASIGELVEFRDIERLNESLLASKHKKLLLSE